MMRIISNKKTVYTRIYRFLYMICTVNLSLSIDTSINVDIDISIDTGITHQYWYEEDDEAQPFSK